MHSSAAPDSRILISEALHIAEMLQIDANTEELTDILGLGFSQALFRRERRIQKIVVDIPDDLLR